MEVTLQGFTLPWVYFAVRRNELSTTYSGHVPRKHALCEDTKSWKALQKTGPKKVLLWGLEQSDGCLHSSKDQLNWFISSFWAMLIDIYISLYFAKRVDSPPFHTRFPPATSCQRPRRLFSPAPPWACNGSMGAICCTRGVQRRQHRCYDAWPWRRVFGAVGFPACHGGTPVYGWFLLGKIPSRNGWLGVPPYMETPKSPPYGGMSLECWVCGMINCGHFRLSRTKLQDPHSPGALNNLAVAEYRQGRMHAAIAPWMFSNVSPWVNQVT